jgi:Fe2+ transport system protein B
MGVDYNEYSNQLINKLNGETPEQQQIRELNAKLEKFEETQKSQANKQYEATISQYKKEIANTVSSNPEFDTIKSLGAEEHVLQLILDTFNEDGEVMTVEQAAKDIEEALLEEAERYAKLTKVQQKLVKSVPQQEEKRVLPAPKSGLRTLTNSIQQVSPSTPRNQFQFMSMKERIAAAVSKAQK